MLVSSGGDYMAEATRLCPACRGIMKPASYTVGKQDGTERIENKIYSWDGPCVLGKLLYCPHCGNLAIVR